MAGESPDKAEQRESAAGGDGKDPRLSVLQDRVDEPTAVFKALAPRTAPEDAGAARDAAEESAEGADGAEGAEDAPEGAASGETAPAGPEAAEDAQDASGGAASREEAPEAAGDAQGASGGAASREDAPEAAGDAQGAPEGDRLRAAVAAWVATEDEEGDQGTDPDETPAASAAAPGAGEPRTGGAEGAAGAGDAGGAGDAEGADAVESVEAGETVEGSEAVAASKSDVVTASAADADETAASDVVADSESADAEPAVAESAAGPERGAEADAAPGTEARTESAAAAPARTTSWAKGGSASEASEAAPAADGESWFASRKPTDAQAEPKSEAEAKSEAAPKGEPKSEAPPKSEPKSEAEPASAPAPAPAPVDQPTAVFKAVKPPAEPKAPAAPPVDQPTTALKLPESMFRPLQGDITQEQPKPKPGPVTPPPAAEAQAPAPSPVTPSLSEPERTRQQPLPPRPPLEILAELTNTPPPPETPLRTGVRRVKIWTPLVILLLVVFAVVQFVRPLPDPALTLSAEPTYTFGGGELQMPWPSEGQGAAEVEGVGSLGTYGPQKPAPIASVAKTMTAYVILRDHPIKGKEKGPKIEVDAKAGEQAKAKDESTAPIKEGQSYTEKELLQLLMIPSGNNVARLLARWDAGSEAAFVEKMNAAAKELGMTDSTYTDPSGLQSSTVSTPLDQLKLAKAVMQYDVFREIVDMPNLTVDGIPGRIENNNKILLEPGVSGIKTGSSTPAGGNLLWAAYTVVDGKKQRILGIVMGAKDADQLWQKLDLAIANSLTVIRQAQKDVTSAAVVKKGQVVGYVDDGLGGTTPVVATKELRAVGWPGLKVKLELTNGGKAVPHSGKTGDVVGQVSIGTGNGKVSAPVALQNDLVEPGFDKKLTRVG